MNILFFGTPDICIPYLEALQNSTHTLVGIVCNRDSYVGRKHILTEPPTKKWGNEHSIEVFQPERLRSFTETSTLVKADLHIVIAYGKILPQDLISLPKFGTINIHYSLLPRWRGASPVEAAILAGDSEIGVCIQQMCFELDSGPIIAEQHIPLYGNEYASELKHSMSILGAELLMSTMESIENRTIMSVEQDASKATFCKKISKSEGEIYHNDTDISKYNKWRAYHPWPGIFYFDNTGIRIKITDADWNEKRFRIKKIVRAGESEITLVM